MESPDLSLKDTAGVAAVLVAVLYGLGYIAREGAIGSTHVGSISITRESAVIVGFVFAMSIAAFLAMLIMVTMPKTSGDLLETPKIVAFAIVVVVSEFYLAFVLVSEDSPHGLFTFLSVLTIPFTMSVVLYLLYSLFLWLNRDTRWAFPCVLPIALVGLCGSAYYFGYICLPIVKSQFGGLEGGSICVFVDAGDPLLKHDDDGNVVSSREGRFFGKVVAEDEHSLVLLVQPMNPADGHVEQTIYRRFPKTSIQLIVPVGKQGEDAYRN